MKRKATPEENREFWNDVANLRLKQSALSHKLYDHVQELMRLKKISGSQRVEILEAQVLIIDNYLRDAKACHEANDPIRHLDVQQALIKAYFRLIEDHFPELRRAKCDA